MRKSRLHSPLGELVDMMRNFEWGQEMAPPVCNYLNRFPVPNRFNMAPQTGAAITTCQPIPAEPKRSPSWHA